MKTSTKKLLLLLVVMTVISGEATCAENLSKQKFRKNPTVENTNTKEVTQSESRFSGSWKVRLSSEKLDDEISQGTATSLRASFKLDYILIPSLRFHGEPRINFSQGQAQSLYGEFEPTNTVGVDEALVNWAPHEFLDFNAGILSHSSEKRIGNSYLMDGQPFPGAEAVIHVLNFEKIKMNFLLEESIPTSYSLDQGVEEKEKSPRFHAQSVNLNYGEKADVFKTSIYATKWQYENLPSIVAQKSISRGNTISDGYHYDYEFAGYSLSAQSSIELFSTFVLKANGSYLINDKAPSGLNKGNAVGGGLDILVSNGVTVISKIEKFYVEPDVAPAYYSTYKLGLGNRQGYLYEAGIELNNYNFKLISGYMDSDLIYKSGLMAKRTGLFIKLETLDVQF